MNVCICDDEKRERELIMHGCEDYFQDRTLPYKIWEAENAMRVWERKDEIDLLILDIEMPEMDGVTLKNRLQNNEEKMLVLFVTSHDEMMSEAFGKNVIGFISKEWISVKLSRYLALAVTLIGNDILIDGNHNSRNIIKIHSEREYCNLYMKDGSTCLIRSSLKEMEKVLLEADFVRISRAWMVNMKFVKEFNKKELIIEDETFSISRNCSKSVEEAYNNFCERNARYC